MSAPVAKEGRKPCPGCPWRVERPHSATIPGYRHSKAEELVSTTRTEGFAPIMACHHSTPGNDIICMGWLVRYGWDNLNVRLMMMDGKVTPDMLDPGEDWPELHPDFATFIEALRRESEES